MKNVIRELRSRPEISRAMLAESLGVSRQTVNAIETGRYLPTLPLAFALSAYSDTKLEELFEPEEGDAG